MTADVGDMPPHSERDIAVFRVCQEALTNVARHAEARRVRVDLVATNGQLELAVQDDGRGIDEAALAGNRSVGLIGMRERAAQLDGELHVRRGAAGGTVVSFTVPLNRKE